MALSATHIYPVKSCRAMDLHRAEVSATGLKGDRMFQVIEADGNPVAQRLRLVLATVRTIVRSDVSNSTPATSSPARVVWMPSRRMPARGRYRNKSNASVR